jgi:hypothetical protein
MQNRNYFYRSLLLDRDAVHRRKTIEGHSEKPAAIEKSRTESAVASERIMLARDSHN